MRFAGVAEEFIDFISGAELIAHNAPFDLNFLEAELQRIQDAPSIFDLIHGGVAIDTPHPFRAQVIAIGLVLMMRSPAGDPSAIPIGGHLQRPWRNIFLHCDVVDLANPINKPRL